MNLLEPRAGDKLSATQYAAMIRELRAIAPIAGPGLRSKRTSHGTILTVVATAAKSAIPPDLSCFRYRLRMLDTASGEGKVPVHTVDNLYYQLAGRTFLWTPDGDDPDFVRFVPDKFVALRVDLSGTEPEPEIATYEDLSELQDDQADGNVYVKPLYMFERGEDEEEEEHEDQEEDEQEEEDERPWRLKIDLRTAIDCGMWEFGTLKEPAADESGGVQ